VHNQTCDDRVVVAHARALLADTRPETIDYIEADLNYPEDILRVAQGKLDFTQPVAIMLGPLYEATNTEPAHNAAVRFYNESGAVPYHLRSPEQVVRCFDGLEPIDPGIVPIQEWRPDERSAGFPAGINAWGGIAVKR
jgi:hypothetical protein